MDRPWWIWLIFISLVVILLIFDIGILNKKDQIISIKKSFFLSAFYIFVALMFGVWVWADLGAQSATQYYTGFLVEKSLALDNIFLISLVFSYLRIPREYQHRVLFWGILGVIILRGIMIGLGAVLVSQFAWILYIFAVFMIIVGTKMLFIKNNKPDLGNNGVLKYLKSHFKIAEQLHGNQFIIAKQDDKHPHKKVYWITPLFVALILVETIDVIFAVDSIPAIFLITTDPYIVYTSNIFAILGLRALYFALDAIIHRFKYLAQALGLVLIFIGSKIFIADLFEMEKFPPVYSLIITFGFLAGGIIYSIYKSDEK